MKGSNVFAELANCKNVKLLGLWDDPEGKYPTMPIFELREETAEEWNAKVRKKQKEVIFHERN